MIICSSSNIDLIQGVTGYGTAADGATDWRIENTATGVFNILNSPNLLAPNVSIIDAGNVGVGTIPVSGTNKLQVQGNLNVSADTLSKTYTATNTTAGTNDILTMRYDTTNGLRFQQTLVAANDVRYDVIQKTNNVDYTSPVISFYKGNVGIGTTNPNAELQITCASTATNPDTGGTIIGLYVHNPTNTATQNSVIYNRIAGSSAGKVIYAFNVASSYGCSLVINGSDTTDRLLRFNSSSDASGTDLMVINNSNGNVSIGNTTTATHKLNVTGSVNVSGGFLVGGVALKPATAVLADTATALAATRNIAGVGFNGSAAIDIPYPNLTNKLTAGTGISISAATTPVISTNLTAGTNVTFTGTAPNITINAAGGTASQWVTTGNNIYYNTGNVGIGTNNPTSILQVGGGGRLKIANSTSDNTIIGTTDADDATNTRIRIFGSTYSGASGIMQYIAASTGYHAFYTGGGAEERLRIASNGNIGIGTNNPTSILQVGGGGRLRISNGSSDYTFIGTNDTTNYTNTRIALYGNTVNGYAGNIELVASSTGSHLFISEGGERMRIASNGNVVIGGNVNVGSLTNPSDSRIKKDIEDINDDTALNKILLIQPTTYNYIDIERNKGFGKVYGFIAQQIREVIPEAVPIINTITPIPNIYKSCLINNKREVYHSIPLDTPIDTSFKINDSLYKIKEIYKDYFVIDNDIEADEAFVYGYNIDDFHTLDKTYIFTLNVCATQELHRRIEAQNVVIQSHDDRIKDLETKMERILSGTT